MHKLRSACCVFKAASAATTTQRFRCAAGEGQEQQPRVEIGHLREGTIAGIVRVMALFGLLAGILWILLCVNRRYKKEQEPEVTQGNDCKSWPRPRSNKKKGV